MSTELATPPAEDIELSGSQIGKLLDFPAQKLATYISNPDRWLGFFPDQGSTGPGRYRYYTLTDAVVIAMLIDTSAPSQALAVEFRRALADEIRKSIVHGTLPVQVHVTIDRITIGYTPRWELLDIDPKAVFD